MTLNFQKTNNHNIQPAPYSPMYVNDLFTKQEIENLHKISEQYPTERAQIGFEPEGRVSAEIRRSNVRWIDPVNCPDWLKQRVEHSFLKTNAEHFKFILNGAEPFQYTIYNSEDSGEYKWHSDTAMCGVDEIRKLSVSILLSEPDEFTGGKLILAPNGNPIVAEERFGRAVFFPSWVPHCVTPVTSGTRKSLVIWSYGPTFK